MNSRAAQICRHQLDSLAGPEEGWKRCVCWGFVTKVAPRRRPHISCSRKERDKHQDIISTRAKTCCSFSNNLIKMCKISHDEFMKAQLHQEKELPLQISKDVGGSSDGKMNQVHQILRLMQSPCGSQTVASTHCLCLVWRSDQAARLI